MLKEMIVLGLTLVVGQTIATFIMMKLFMSKAFIKKITKQTFETMNEVVEDLEDLQ